MEMPRLIILVAPPGAGKTTYAEKLVSKNDYMVRLSSDSIREMLYGDESIQGDPSEVFSVMNKKAVEHLHNGKTVIYDATNMSRKDRAEIIHVCPKYVKTEAHIIWQPIEVLIERDSLRERSVGKEVIDRMLKRFQAPYYDEGFDVVLIVREGIRNAKYKIKLDTDMKIPHDNPHHTLNIYEHCLEAMLGVRGSDHELMMAARYHDIGKPYVKAFVDSNGNPCEHAHYYQHQCVGAWMSYGITNDPKTAWLISTHMEPFLGTKYYRNLPPFLKKDIDLLHEADKEAH